MKCVIIVDQTLPPGLLANAAAVLALSIGCKFNEIVGEAVADKDGGMHAGITQLPIPILRGDNELIHAIRAKLVAKPSPELYFVDFCDVAQRSRHYSQYQAALRKTTTAQLTYFGLAICGPEPDVTSLTGHIGLLR